MSRRRTYLSPPVTSFLASVSVMPWAAFYPQNEWGLGGFLPAAGVRGCHTRSVFAGRLRPHAFG